MNDTNFHLRKLEKEDQNKSKSEGKEKIKTKAEINGENRKQRKLKKNNPALCPVQSRNLSLLLLFKRECKYLPLPEKLFSSHSPLGAFFMPQPVCTFQENHPGPRDMISINSVVLIAKYTEDSRPTWQGLHHLF